MTSEKFQNIIIKYLNKQASVMELEALEKWLEEDATHQKYFINYVKINYLIDLNLKEFDTHLAQQKLETFIKKEKKVRKLKRTSVFITSYTTKLFFCKIPLSLHQLSLSLH